MSGAASYLARRAAQKERVRILYRRALKDTLTWAVHRHLFYPDADALRERFDANKNVAKGSEGTAGSILCIGRSKKENSCSFFVRCKSARCKTHLNFINMRLLEKIEEKATYGNCAAFVSVRCATEEQFQGLGDEHKRFA